MTVDVSVLLTRLAQRAEMHAEQLRLNVDNVRAALVKADEPIDDRYLGDSYRSLDDAWLWIGKARTHRAKLDEVQGLIGAVTNLAAEAAKCGRNVVEQ